MYACTHASQACFFAAYRGTSLLYSIRDVYIHIHKFSSCNKLARAAFNRDICKFHTHTQINSEKSRNKKMITCRVSDHTFIHACMYTYIIHTHAHIQKLVGNKCHIRNHVGNKCHIRNHLGNKQNMQIHVDK